MTLIEKSDKHARLYWNAKRSLEELMRFVSMEMDDNMTANKIERIRDRLNNVRNGK